MCRLEQLPDSIGNATRLVKLQASFNQLQALPASLGKLPKLELMRVAANCIAEVAHAQHACVLSPIAVCLVQKYFRVACTFCCWACTACLDCICNHQCPGECCAIEAGLQTCQSHASWGLRGLPWQATYRMHHTTFHLHPNNPALLERHSACSQPAARTYTAPLKPSPCHPMQVPPELGDAPVLAWLSLGSNPACGQPPADRPPIAAILPAAVDTRERLGDGASGDVFAGTWQVRHR